MRAHHLFRKHVRTDSQFGAAMRHTHRRRAKERTFLLEQNEKKLAHPDIVELTLWGINLDYSTGFGYFGLSDFERIYRDRDEKRIAQARRFIHRHPARAAEIEAALAAYVAKVAPLYQRGGTRVQKEEGRAEAL